MKIGASISKESNGFIQMECGWYRKIFAAPAEWQDRKVFIEFEGIPINAEVWLHDDLLGRHPYGYASLQYDLTPCLKIAGRPGQHAAFRSIRFPPQ